MLDLGKILVNEGKEPSELNLVPRRLRDQTMYSYAVHHASSEGWRPDYSLEALVKLNALEQRKCSAGTPYDISPFNHLGVSVEDGKLKLDLAKITELAYGLVRKRKDSRVALGLLAFCKSQGLDVGANTGARRLVAYALDTLPKHTFNSVHLLSEIMQMKLMYVSDIIGGIHLSAELKDRLLPENLNHYVKELALKGDFGTAELITHQYHKLGLAEDRKASVAMFEQVARAMLAEGNAAGLEFYFSAMGSRSHLLKSVDLGAVVVNAQELLKSGDIEEGLRYLSLAKLAGAKVELSQKEVEQAHQHLAQKVKRLRNSMFEPFRIKHFIESIDCLGLNPGDHSGLRQVFLKKLRSLKWDSIITNEVFLNCCDSVGITFKDVCELGYAKIESREVTSGFKILQAALMKYPADSYIEDTGDSLLRRFEDRDMKTFRTHVQSNLERLAPKILDSCYAQIESKDYAIGVHNLWAARSFGIEPEFAKRLTPEKLLEAACRTMETKHYFPDGYKLLNVAIKLGTEFDTNTRSYLARVSAGYGR